MKTIKMMTTVQIICGIIKMVHCKTSENNCRKPNTKSPGVLSPDKQSSQFSSDSLKK